MLTTKMNLLCALNLPPALQTLIPHNKAVRGGDKYYYLSLDKESEVQAKFNDLTKDDKVVGFGSRFLGSLLNARPIQ